MNFYLEQHRAEVYGQPWEAATGADWIVYAWYRRWLSYCQLRMHILPMFAFAQWKEERRPVGLCDARDKSACGKTAAWMPDARRRAKRFCAGADPAMEPWHIGCL